MNTTATREYYVRTAAGEFGPFTLNQLRNQWRDSRLTLRDEVRSDVTMDWHPLAVIAEVLEAPAEVQSNAQDGPQFVTTIAEPPALPKKKSFWRRIAETGLAVFLCFVGLMVLILIMDRASQRSPEQEKELAKYSAWADAKYIVEKHLIAPSTAKFSEIDEGNRWHAYQIKNGMWDVTGWVDSQNAFGAMLRQEWVVELDESVRPARATVIMIGGKVVYLEPDLEKK